VDDSIEERAESPVAGQRWRWSRWLTVLTLLTGMLGACVWASSPSHDPRLVGEWQSENGRSAWVFHANGQLELLDLPARTHKWSGRSRWWRVEGDDLVTGTQTPKSRLRNWVTNLQSPWTKFGVVGLSDSRYKIVELTETDLQLLLVRKPPRPPVPAEMLHRVR